MAGARSSRRRGPGGPVVPALPVTEVRRGSVANSTLVPGAAALVLPLAAGGADEGVEPRTGVADAATRYGIDLGELAARLPLTGAAGEAETVHLPVAASGAGLPWDGLPPRLVLVGIGDGSPAALRRAGAAVARVTRGLGTVVTTVGADTGGAGARAVVEGYLLGAYRHPRITSRPAEPGPAERLVLLGRFSPDAVEKARVHAAASWTARTLAATPASIKSPAWLADRAVELATEAGLTVSVLDEVELAEAGFGGIVAVGAGSATPPRLVTVTYEPPGTAARHVVVVGKGITYDTGGLSIKPREAMVPMKTDMTGAAVALATVLGAAAAGVRHRVTALLPLAENAVGGASYRPGDVLTLVDGTTVEIRNTDAEGRLVLADALAHAAARLDPDVLIDVATLTGAATLGLGRGHGALYASDDQLARSLVVAGAAAGEPLWRMPLVADYEGAMASTIADVCHVQTDPNNRAGSITAALFLRRFTGGRPWAHLDIAGPARSPKASHELPEGATGFGARVLLEWLSDLR